MGKWTHLIAEGLEGLAHKVTLWFGNEFPLFWRHRRLATLLYSLALALRLARSRHRFDVVVIHEPSGFWYGILRKVFSSLPPFVAMCHNVESKHYKELLAAEKKGLTNVPRGMRVKVPLFRLWQSDGALKLADHIVCLSKVDKDYLVESLGRSAEKISVLTNGVSLPDLFSIRSRTSARRVLFVGGWLDVKGRRLMPALWSDVVAEFPDATLTLLGTGHSAETVKRDFPVDVRSSISVIPRINGDEAMIGQYADHDVFLMPSLSEGSPLSLLEAMASALPVVATSVGGIKDIVTDGSDGLLFDPASPVDGARKINKLLSDEDFASRLGVSGRERVRKLTWLAAAKRLDTALQRAGLGNNHAITITVNQ
jgi:glycosyltransferase involved in cell wall biosynthesis